LVEILSTTKLANTAGSLFMLSVMNQRIVRIGDIAMYDLPINKGGPDNAFTKEDDEPMFTDPKVDGYETHLELHLGSLAGYTLQGKPTSMEKFVAYLNRKFGNLELGNLILKKLRVLRNQLEEFFREKQNEEKQNEEKQSIWWFPEISFVPNRYQVEDISDFCRSLTFKKIAAKNGYTDPIEFVRDLLFSPENKSTLFIDGQELTLEELLYQTNQPKNFAQELKELEEWLSKAEQLEISETELKELNQEQYDSEIQEKKKQLFSGFLRKIISYYYFDFTGITHLDKLLSIEKIIASTSARVDMLGFKVIEPNDQEAINLLNTIKSKRTLNHLLLDFDRFLGSEDEELIFDLLKLITEGKIKVIFIEIKSYFRPEVIALLRKQTQLTESDSPQRDTLQLLRKHRNQRFKIPPEIPGLSIEESRDISHSLLAMFQFFARLATHPAKTEISALEKLKKLMSSEYSSRKMAIRTLIKLSKCIETYFIRVNWPIVDQDPNSGNQRGSYLNTSAVNQYDPELEIIQVEQTKILKLIRNVLARARNMLEEIFK
jgi:hypothetical protein